MNKKYKLDRRLGAGGMAEVFLAHAIGAEGFTRTVAIKRVLAGYSQDPKFAQMFVSEAQLSSRLQHPNVVMVVDFDRDDEGRLFLVMEHVDGPDLAQLFETGLVPVAATIHLVTEILRGLAHAHDLPAGADGTRGIVHRDMSPHNVLLSWEGAVKVSDFGIAKARAASNATASELIKGKPAYMSPEQANGERLDGRSDLFAVGVMLWELLCGRRLFSGESTQETLARLMFAPIPPPTQLRPQLAPDLERVTMRLLARDRAERYASANEAIADLVACRDHPRNGRELLVGLLAERFAERAPDRIGPPSEVPTVESGPAVGRLPGPMDARPATKPRSMWPLLVAVAVFGCGLGLVLASRRDAPPQIAAVSIDAAPVPVPVPVAVADAGVVAIDAAPRARKPAPPVDDWAAQIAKTGVLVTINNLIITGLDEDVVRAHWTTRIPAMRACYREAMRAFAQESPDTWLEGWQNLAFTIDGSGAITWKNRGGETHPVISTCTVKLVEDGQFPRPADGSADVKIIMFFKSCAETTKRPCP